MEIGAVFFLLALIVVVGMYVGQPLLTRRGKRATKEDHEISALMAEYDRTLDALQELEFDNTLGKIPAEDYPRQRVELLQRGAELLRQLDEHGPAAPAGRSTTAEDRLKAAVAARRADSAGSVAVAEINDDDLESLISMRRKDRKDKSAGFCPKCGKPILVSDRFCPSCGKAIN